MKRILLENAYEAWASAIEYCDAIAQGMATLSYQKKFVSSLHNAVELFFKQLLIDQGDHSVASMRSVKDKKDARLYLDYMESTDLNRFFGGLTNAEVDKFASLEFKTIIEKFKKVALKDGQEVEIKSDLKRLQELRNNETHFMISGTSFLTEDDFIILHNFMIRFYQIIKGQKLVPFWGEAWDEDKRLVFERKPIISFSYLDSLKKSTLAQHLVTHLNGTYDIGTPTCTSYEIAYELCSREEQLNAQFDKVWSLIEMFQRYGLIQYENHIEDIPNEIDPCNQQQNIYYKMIVVL